MASASRSVDEFGKSGATISRSLQTTNTSLNNVGRSAGGFGRSIAGQATIAQRAFGGFTSSIVSGAGLVVGALAPLAGGVALAGFASSAISTRVTFERELANVGALARATTSEVAQLSAQAEALGASTSFAATDVLGGQRFLALSGFEVPEIITALPGLLNTAAAAQEDLALTSDIVTNALTGFQLGVSETSRVSDVLIATITSSNTNLTDLGQALSFVAPESARVGESVEATSAALGLLADAGLRATRGGTGLRRIFSNLITPVGDAGDALEGLGIQTFDQEGNFLGLANVLEQFEGALDGVSQQGREDVLSQIFDTNSLTAFSILLSAGSDDLREFTTELENSGGIAEQVAGRQLDNLAGDITRAQSAYEGLQLAITRRATPALRGFFNQGLIPGITATTNFVEALNDGQSTLRAFSIGFTAIAPNTSEFIASLADISDAVFGLQNLNLNLDGILGLDTFRVFRLDDLLTFEIGDFSGLVRGAFDEVELNLGDFITFEFDSSFAQLQIGDFINFTSQDIGDLFTGGIANITKLTIGDLIDFTATSGPAGSTININDVIIGSYDLANNITSVAIGDLITGSLDLTTGQGSVTIGDDLTFEFDLGALQSQIQSQLTGLQDFFVGTSGGFEAGTFVPPTAGLAQNISDAVSDALSGDFTFELPDIGGQLQSALDIALGGVALSFAIPALAAAEAFEIEIPAPLLDFVVPDIAGQELNIEIPAPLLDFTIPNIAGQTFEIDIPAPLLSFTTPLIGTETISVTIPNPDISYLLPVIETETISVDIPEPILNFLSPVLGDTTTVDIPIPAILTDFDFASLSGGLDTLGNALSGLDEGIAGAIGDDSAFANFVTLINEQIGGLATTLDNIDSTTVGESITNVITSLTSIFTQLNTIDDLALGGIAGSLSDLTQSILNFAIGVTAGLDADAIGEAAANSAAAFISSFQAVLSEPDLPGIALAASSLVAGIGEQFRTAFEPGNFTIVGASLGQLAQTIVDQLTSALSDPEIGESIGSGFADILIGVTQGLVDVRDGAAAELEGSGNELQNAVQIFTGSLITALSESLAEADYSSLADALIGGIISSVTGALTPDPVEMSGAISTDRFAGEELPQELFSLPELPEFPTPLADFLNAGADLVGIDGSTLEGITGASDGVNQLSNASTELATATQAATEATQAAAAAQAAAAEAAPEPGFFGNILDFFGFGGGAAPVEEARRTGVGVGAAFDETDIAGSIQDQILTQLNFGDLPQTVSDAATGAIATAIPAESLINPELITSALAEAVSAAIPPEPVIDAETVNETLLIAAQEAIPASEIPTFPGWERVLNFRVPTIPSFPPWQRLLNFRVPRIPRFPGWGSLVNFDIPSIPAFPGWEALTGAADLAALIPPFPGWAALINVAVNIPNVSCELACGGGSGGGGTGGGTGGGSTGGGSGGEFSPQQAGTDFFPGGLALVSEAGNEAIVLPSGESFIARGEQLLDLPRGTRIINANETSALFNNSIAGAAEQSSASFTPNGTPIPTTRTGQLIQSAGAVTNIVNNVTRNFNLTTETLRSTEQVNADFANMERLASLSGVI